MRAIARSLELLVAFRSALTAVLTLALPFSVPAKDSAPLSDALAAKILANPDDEEHADMVTWMGLEHACEFDPAAFDIEAVNRRLVAVGSPR